jgi:hypothetical protein
VSTSSPMEAQWCFNLGFVPQKLALKGIASGDFINICFVLVIDGMVHFHRENGGFSSLLGIGF